MLELGKIFEEIDNLYVDEIDFGVDCNLEECTGQPCNDNCCECIKEACKNIIRKHMHDEWNPVEEKLPEEKVNPVSQDFYEYQVTAQFGSVKDVRHYKYGNGHWWHGPGIMDKYVIAWRPLPEPYQAERSNGGLIGNE